jgi:DNA polymerase-4
MRDQFRHRPTEPILHVDLDAFYASVEVLKDPALAGKPVVVGSPGPRGVVMSASYAARAKGLHSAMPSVRARRLCPEAVFMPLSVSPVVEPLSLDEAFLDVSGATMLFGGPERIARQIRAGVKSELDLTASVGVGPNKFIAKLASVQAKPDGLLLVPANEVTRFLHPLPVDALWGIGEKTAQVLSRLGIRTVEELARTPAAILERVLGDVQSRSLLELAWGRDERTVVPFEAPKSVSHEETYPRDLDDDDEILREILALSHRVAGRLRADGYRARTVTLKLRLPSFSTLTRSRTLPTPADTGADLFTVARELFLKMPEGRRRFRLIGVAATGLVPAGSEQLALVRSSRWRDAEQALDRVERRFGRGAARPATLLVPRPRADRGE